MTCGWLALGAGAVHAAGPKYYFQLHEVKAGPEVSPELKAYAGEAVKADLAARPEWASEIGAHGTDAIVAELKKRNLKGFDVTVRIESIKKDLKEPGPGSRLKRLALTARVSVFGTTIPEEKLAFSGDGEAGLESEVTEKRLEAEETGLAKDALKDAVKQAVDQAVLKLSLGASAPMNEARRKKKK
jgi:hypothetical protein